MSAFPKVDTLQRFWQITRVDFDWMAAISQIFTTTFYHVIGLPSDLLPLRCLRQSNVANAIRQG